MNNISGQNMLKTAKHIRISELTHKKILKAKSDFKFSSIDDVISYLFEEKKEILDENHIADIKEKYILMIEENIFKRLESTHKRLGQFEKSYFRKIIDTSNVLEQFNTNIMRIVNGDIEKSKPNNSINYEERYLEFKENWTLCTNKNYENETEIRNLKNKIDRIKQKFTHKNSTFSNFYESKLSPEEFENIFK